MTPMPSFEFCAFRFLAQWEESEYALYNAIRSTPTEKDIRKALSYFQVARNFEGLKEAANAAFVVQSLLEVRADQANSKRISMRSSSLSTRAKFWGDNPYRLAYDFAFVQGAWLMKQLGEVWSVFRLRRARNL
jgi:hypothetical protein